MTGILWRWAVSQGKHWSISDGHWSGIKIPRAEGGEPHTMPDRVEHSELSVIINIILGDSNNIGVICDKEGKS